MTLEAFHTASAFIAKKPQMFITWADESVTVRCLLLVQNLNVLPSCTGIFFSLFCNTSNFKSTIVGIKKEMLSLIEMSLKEIWNTTFFSVFLFLVHFPLKAWNKMKHFWVAKTSWNLLSRRCRVRLIDRSFLPALQLSYLKYWNSELLLSNTDNICSEVIINTTSINV